MTKQTPTTLTKSTKEQKSDFHKHKDPLHEMSGFDRRDQIKFQSLKYQFIAAMLLGVHDIFDSKGIINPYVGNHHAANLPAEYHLMVHDILKYITDLNGRNLTKLSVFLRTWHTNVSKEINKLPLNLSEKQREEAIRKIVSADKTIILAQEKLDIKLIEKAEIKSDSTAPEEENSEKPKIVKAEKAKSLEDIYIEALFLDICGEVDKAKAKFKEVRNYKKDVEEKSALSPSDENERQNLIYFDIHEFYAEKFPAKTQKYREKMAQAGVPAALNDLGLDHYGKKQYLEAFKKCKAAADKGYAKAQYNIAVFYQNGIGVDKNIKEAERFYKLAVTQDFAQAQYRLGILYEDLLSSPKNIKQAIKLYQSAADQGHAEAQNHLGSLYLSGELVGKDLLKAASLFQLAANQGLGLSQCDLGLMYLKGEGVEQNSTEAVKLLKLASDQGIQIAQYNLGSAYFMGEKGVEKNLEEALKFFKLSADQGNEVAKKNTRILAEQLAQSYLTGDNGKPQSQKAIELFKISSEYGSARAPYILANMYFTGTAVEKDCMTAYSFMKLADERGVVDAKNQLPIYKAEAAKQLMQKPSTKIVPQETNAVNPKVTFHTK